MSVVLVVVLAVGAAAAYAVAANLKHASAARAPDARSMTGRAVAGFVRATATQKLFLLSIVADVVGVTLQVLALRRGALAEVQPLLVSGLVLALFLRARSGGHVSRREIGWGVVLAVALSLFLAVAGVSGHADGRADPHPAALLGVAGALVAGACVLTAHHRRGRRGAAALVGLAVGVIDASVAALLKTLVEIARHGVGAVFSTWVLPLLAVLVAVAMVLNQVAFQAGPISASLPVISSVDPLVSVVIGVVVFDETMRHGPRALAAMAALAVVLVSAVVALSRVAAQRGLSNTVTET